MKARDRKLVEARIRALPALSQSAFDLVALVGDETHAREDLAKIVKADPALAVRVLGAANSAAFAPLQEVNDTGTAIGILGERLLVALAVDHGTAGVLREGLKGYGSEPGHLQQQSIKTAIAAQLIAQRPGTAADPGLAYTAGLVHDIGRLVVSPLLEQHAGEIRASSGSDPRDYCAAEREVLGTDHCAVGAQVADKWGLSPALRAVIAHHHAPGEAPEEHRALVDAVHFGGVVAMLTGGDSAVDALAHQADPGAAERLGISARELMGLILETLLEYERSAASLG